MYIYFLKKICISLYICVCIGLHARMHESGLHVYVCKNISKEAMKINGT